MTFPDNQDFPPSFSDLALVSLISFLISVQLWFPIFSIRFRRILSSFTVMPVPKTAMDEYHLFALREYHIRFAGKFTVMEFCIRDGQNPIIACATLIQDQYSWLSLFSYEGERSFSYYNPLIAIVSRFQDLLQFQQHWRSVLDAEFNGRSWNIPFDCELRTVKLPSEFMFVRGFVAPF